MGQLMSLSCQWSILGPDPPVIMEESSWNMQHAEGFSVIRQCASHKRNRGRQTWACPPSPPCIFRYSILIKKILGPVKPTETGDSCHWKDCYSQFLREGGMPHYGMWHGKLVRRQRDQGENVSKNLIVISSGRNGQDRVRRLRNG